MIVKSKPVFELNTIMVFLFVLGRPKITTHYVLEPSIRLFVCFVVVAYDHCVPERVRVIVVCETTTLFLVFVYNQLQDFDSGIEILVVEVLRVVVVNNQILNA